MGVIDFKAFDVGTVSLKGSNLVEASAGTGKTYSIAILALRLILEKEIPLKEILMVTFTKDAVAELQIRIRKFVREAYRYSIKDSLIENDDIKTLVDNKGKQKSQELLTEAIRQLDETSILTIHSFCQNTLTEFAFETGQGYNLKLLEDLSDVIEDEVKGYWRKDVSNINKCDLIKIINEIPKYKISKDWFLYFDVGTFKSALKNSLDNKTFIKNKTEFDVTKDIEVQENETEKKILKIITEKTADYINKINSHTGSRYTDNTRAKFIQKLSDPKEFLAFILKTNDKNALQIFDIDIKCFKELRKQKDSLKKVVFEQLIKNVLDSKTKEIKKRLNLMNQVSYDDLIENLHQSVVVKKNESLKEILRERYKAVFVDEFQDTDKFQFEIFNTVFNNDENILFYIGDPKQSIYGFRKADINTYFNARSAVGNTYTMNTNYRSTKPLINGLNEVFSETDYQGDDTEGVGLFCNEKESSEEKKITYHNVDAYDEVEKKICYLSGVKETPLTIYNENKNKDQIRANVINLIQSLLSTGTLGENTQKITKIKASDIAILVRKGFDGGQLKEGLNKLGIPSVLIDDTKIFGIDETKDILYLLQAIQESSSSSLHKALLSKLTGYTRTDIEKLNLNFHMTRFKKYQGLFNSKGIYACILAFYKDYQTHKNLLGSYDSVEKSGLKSYSNLLQLAEALQRIQKERGYELTSLITFLKKAIEGEEIQGDEYEQRIESDEEAVQISTIHKSKGLQYNIVIAPYLDLEVKSKGAFSSFRNEEGEYVFEPNYNKPEVNNADFIIQTEQENRRLIYVALTRAKYQLYAFTQEKASLGAIIKDKQNSDFLAIKPYEEQEVEVILDNEFEEQLVFAEPNQPFELKDKDWYKMSFSFFNLPHAPVQKTFNTANEGYDYFIFKELERGAHIGNLLHTIFEYIDFTNPEKWQRTIDLNLKKYIPRKEELYRPKMDNFLNHVLNSEIKVNDNVPFKLSQIPNSKRLNELEFDLRINKMDLSKLYDLQTESVQFSFRNIDLNGILNGLIDLFFEHDNKYYIVDWKSNYLGDSLSDYTPHKLNDAMNESNYHLQYYIYTMAAKRFLESKLDDFDYEKQFGGVIYLFLRGVRTNADTGIFTTKLQLETVEKIEEVFCLDIAVK